MQLAARKFLVREPARFSPEKNGNRPMGRFVEHARTHLARADHGPRHAAITRTGADHELTVVDRFRKRADDARAIDNVDG